MRYLAIAHENSNERRERQVARVAQVDRVSLLDLPPSERLEELPIVPREVERVPGSFVLADNERALRDPRASQLSPPIAFAVGARIRFPFVRENFGVEPDPKQTEALLKFARAQRSASKPARASGRPASKRGASGSSRRPGRTRTSPSSRSRATTCRTVSGRSSRSGTRSRAFLKSEFEVQKTRIIHKRHPNTWWISARQWSKSANAEQQANALAGLHADFTMFCIDEVGGIPLAVTATAEAALASGIESKLLMGGNPTHTEGPLYMACTAHAHLWEVVQITGDPDDPKRSNRMDITWARQQIEMYGREHPWVKVNVFGEFPPSSINALLGPERRRGSEEALRRAQVPRLLVGAEAAGCRRRAFIEGRSHRHLPAAGA
jgi:hypothetical protein